MLGKLQSSTSALSGTLNSYLGSIGTMQTGFIDTQKAIEGAQAELKVVSEFVSALAGSNLLAEVTDTLESEGDLVGNYLASPIKMDTVVKFDIKTYGSAMAPFYTVLAQWVGALLSAVFLKVKIRKEHEPANLRLHERFFGRIRSVLPRSHRSGDHSFARRSVLCPDPVRRTVAVYTRVRGDGTLLLTHKLRACFCA